ncbi:uncharacterized protein [Littorina saxatilis]|uniref:uncharacterized protein n=1 Tax=Littorina saxatilis TaxID=31220 RepID=UPI0038B60BB3
MVYQEHLTKFCVLRALTTKRAAEVAYQLLDIFLLFGAPQILQSDNGAEFCAKVITELKELWPDLVLVHGKPRHPQSQGSVERANSDIKDMMTTWMADNSTTNWTVGLKFVQFQKNNSYHSGIKQTPFAALFGADAKIGLTSSSIPNEVLQRLQSEDDLQAALGSPEAGSSTLMLGSPEAAPSTTVLGSPEAASSTIVLGSPEAAPSTIVPGLPTSLLQHEVMDFEPGSSTPPSGRSTPGHLTPASGRSTPGPSTSASGRSTPGPSTSASGRSTPGHLTPASGRSTPGPSTPASGRSTTGSSTPASGRSTPGPSTRASGRSTPGSSTPASGRSTPGPSMSGIDKHKNNILVSRKRAYQAQENQAERMVKRSKRIFPEAEVGDSVTVPIPAVDRGRFDPRNLIGNRGAQRTLRLNYAGDLRELHTRSYIPQAGGPVLAARQIAVTRTIATLGI